MRAERFELPLIGLEPTVLARLYYTLKKNNI